MFFSVSFSLVTSSNPELTLIKINLVKLIVKCIKNITLKYMNLLKYAFCYISLSLFLYFCVLLEGKHIA